MTNENDAAAIDAAIVDGYKRCPAPEHDAWAVAGAVAALRAEPWFGEVNSGEASRRPPEAGPSDR